MILDQIENNRRPEVSLLLLGDLPRLISIRTDERAELRIEALTLYQELSLDILNEAPSAQIDRTDKAKAVIHHDDLRVKNRVSLPLVQADLAIQLVDGDLVGLLIEPRLRVAREIDSGLDIDSNTPTYRS